jgi:hypothetical protein
MPKNLQRYIGLPDELKPVIRAYLKDHGCGRYISHLDIGRVVGGGADDLYIELVLILTPVPGDNHEQD